MVSQHSCFSIYHMFTLQVIQLEHNNLNIEIAILKSAFKYLPFTLYDVANPKLSMMQFSLIVSISRLSRKGREYREEIV